MENFGLSQKEAEKRLKQFGENKLIKKREIKWLKVLGGQFKSPLIYILVLASGVTWFLGEITDAAVIGAAVGLNTVLGFYQEMKAEKGLEALGKILAWKAKVIRDNSRQVIEAEKIVVGDICVLEIGERIPADGAVIEGNSLSINEAILTGESAAVEKNPGDKIYSGTIAAGGAGLMKVELIGQATRVGQIADKLGEAQEPITPLQKNVQNLSGTLAIVVGVIALGVLLIGLMKGYGLGEMFPVAVALAVAAIPEGLAVSLTVILTMGMMRILKQKAVVRRLLAAETLGAVTVICCDKTGTLTEGKMMVIKAITQDEKLLRQVAVWCNDMRDPLEMAMSEWSGFDPAKSRFDEIPFSHEKKYLAVLYPGLLLVSGAPEVILLRSNLTRIEREKYLNQFEREAEKGHRLVGFAYKKIEAKKIDEKEIKNLTWLGVLAFEDPVRAGVKDALEVVRRAGIKIKVITGDYQATALAVARQVGIKAKDVYSRTSPEQKLAIVEKLQNEGEVVAMMGDGVNDAPALKKADIGIVVQDASSVAQETADMVLLDSNFQTIAGAVEEGRGIYWNLKKVVLYLLSHNFSEVILISGSLILNLPLALMPVQILWINLISDSVPSFALTLEPKPKGIMTKKFMLKRGELIDRKTKILTLAASGLTGLTALAVFYFSLKISGVEIARSLIFTLMVLITIIYSFSCKNPDKPVWQGKIWDNPWLIAAAIGGGMLQFLALTAPALRPILGTVSLNLSQWSVVIGTGLMIILIIETVKVKIK